MWLRSCELRLQHADKRVGDWRIKTRKKIEREWLVLAANSGSNCGVC